MSNSVGTLAHYRSLDAFRGLAALSVFLTHLIGTLLFTVELDRGSFVTLLLEWYNKAFRAFIWITNPHPGVVGFIVLSGFCIHLGSGPGLLRRSAPTSRATFFARRFWRVLPTYWIGCLLGVLAALVAGKADGFDGWDILTKLTTLPAWIATGASAGLYEQGNGPLVTVMAEVWLYLIYPFGLMAARRFGWGSVLAVATTLTLACYLEKPPFEMDRWWLISATPLGFLLFWWIGAYGAELLTRSAPVCERIRPKVLAIAYLTMLVLAYSVFRWDFLRNLMFSLLCGALLIFLCRHEALLSMSGQRILSGLSWLGERSFTLYAIHSPLLVLALAVPAGEWLGGGKMATAWWVLGICIVAMQVSFHLVEKPSHFRARKVGGDRAA